MSQLTTGEVSSKPPEELAPVLTRSPREPWIIMLNQGTLDRTSAGFYLTRLLCAGVACLVVEGVYEGITEFGAKLVSAALKANIPVCLVSEAWLAPNHPPQYRFSVPPSVCAAMTETDREPNFLCKVGCKNLREFSLDLYEALVAEDPCAMTRLITEYGGIGIRQLPVKSQQAESSGDSAISRSRSTSLSLAAGDLVIGKVVPEQLGWHAMPGLTNRWLVAQVLPLDPGWPDIRMVAVCTEGQLADMELGKQFVLHPDYSMVPQPEAERLITTLLERGEKVATGLPALGISEGDRLFDLELGPER